MLKHCGLSLSNQCEAASMLTVPPPWCLHSHNKMQLTFSTRLMLCILIMLSVYSINPDGWTRPLGSDHLNQTQHCWLRSLPPHQSWHPWAGHYLRKGFLMSKPHQLPGGLLCCCSWVSVKLFFINTARVSNLNCRVLECLREWGQRGVMSMGWLGGQFQKCYRIIHVQLIKVQTDLNMMEFEVLSILPEERRK